MHVQNVLALVTNQILGRMYALIMHKVALVHAAANPDTVTINVIVGDISYVLCSNGFAKLFF